MKPSKAEALAVLLDHAEETSEYPLEVRQRIARLLPQLQLAGPWVNTITARVPGPQSQGRRALALSTSYSDEFCMVESWVVSVDLVPGGGRADYWTAWSHTPPVQSTRLATVQLGTLLPSREAAQAIADQWLTREGWLLLPLPSPG